MNVLALDPSGNFKEGDGTTGWALFTDENLKDFGRVCSSNYIDPESYWLAVINVIASKVSNKDAVVCESFKLFAHKAKQQSGSEMETPQLIGALRMYCYGQGIKMWFQDPKDKVRVADPILVQIGILEVKANRYYALGRQTVIHERDAIRHGVFFGRYAGRSVANLRRSKASK